MAAFFAFVALVFAAVALFKIRELRDRLDRLELALRDLKPSETEVRGWGSTPAPPARPQAISKDPGPQPSFSSHTAPTSQSFPVPVPPPISPPPISPPPISPPPISTAPPTPQLRPSPPAPPRDPGPPPPQVLPAPQPRIEWERWLGVRGAAVLGGIFLAAAGVLFFQYSIQQGWITKELRVALGSIAGVACLVVGEILRRRGYAVTANAITGAGAVILYAAFWSAHLLGIFVFGVSFALMVGVTVLCCFLSWRNESQLVAWLGLSGGFATPLLLSTGRDEPIALFGYMMLLDASFLFVANRRRWPLVGALGLLGTLVIQGLWFFTRMGPATFGIGIVSLGMFALLFAFLAPTVVGVVGATGPSGSERQRWLAMQVGALLLPFVFAVHFAGRVDVGYHLYPLTLFSALLAAAACWMARKQDATFVPVGAAAGGGAIALVWVLSNELETARAWELAVCALFSCAVLHVFCEWRRQGAGEAAKGHDAALAVAVFGMMVTLFAACFNVSGVNVWPLLAGFTLVPLFLLRLDALAPRSVRPFLACVPACLAIAVWMNLHPGEPKFAGSAETIVAAMIAPVVFLAAALARKDALARKMSFAAAAVACLPLFTVFALGSGRSWEPSITFLTVLALGFLMALASSGARSGILLGLASLATMLTHWAVESDIPPPGNLSHAPDAGAGIAVVLASSALFALWPLLRRSIWTESRTIAWTTPMAVLFGCPPALEMWRAAHGGTWRGLPPAFFALLLLAAAGWALRGRRDELRAERRASRTAIATLGIHDLVLAAFFLGLAVTKELDRAIWPPTLAALCLGAALVWRKTDHAPLKYVSVVSASLATAIALLTALGERHEIFAFPLLSGHGFDFLLPGTALVGALLLGHAREVSRARPSEAELYRQGFPVISGIVGLGGLVFILLWITVEVENRFATGDFFRLEFGDMPARDLSLSIAWAVFALLLLLVGMGRRIGVLRWVSLVLLLATIGKVFLLDLMDLRGLYRVGSFLGLAVSLLAVSLLYQRFVFRKSSGSAA